MSLSGVYNSHSKFTPFIGYSMFYLRFFMVPIVFNRVEGVRRGGGGGRGRADSARMYLCSELTDM